MNEDIQKGKNISIGLTGLLGVTSSIQEAAGRSPPHRSLFHPPPKIQEPCFVPNVENIQKEQTTDII